MNDSLKLDALKEIVIKNEGWTHHLLQAVRAKSYCELIIE